MQGYIYTFDIGEVTFIEKNNSLFWIMFGRWDYDLELVESPLMKETKRQFDEYFAGKRKTFDLPLLIEGTEFQKAVWNELLRIPYGETRSYEDIAKSINKPKACRAVGNANNKNRFPIIIPCHRVIRKNGNLGGFANEDYDVKENLLLLEEEYR